MNKDTSFSDYAFISIGSNLPSGIGNPLATVEFAFEKLSALSTYPVLKSSVFSSSPVDSPEGTPDFLNAIAGIIPAVDVTSLSLLLKLQMIENEAGRLRSGIKNEARTLDLDLIVFRGESLNTPELVIPHPRAHERRFVLEPLIELVGNSFFLPGMDKSLEEQLLIIGEQQQVRKI